MPAKKSKTVCRVLWFDERGRFAKPPNTPETNLRARLGKPKPGSTKKIRVDGGGTATIRYLKGGVTVRYVPPAEIRNEVAKRKKDRKYMAAYRRWLKQVQLELAKDANEERRLMLRQKFNAAMTKSQLSDRGRKGAQERKKAESIRKSLKELSNSELLKFQPKTVYEKRAQRSELKARGLV